MSGVPTPDPKSYLVINPVVHQPPMSEGQAEKFDWLENKPEWMLFQNTQNDKQLRVVIGFDESLRNCQQGQTAAIRATEFIFTYSCPRLDHSRLFSQCNHRCKPHVYTHSASCQFPADAASSSRADAATNPIANTVAHPTANAATWPIVDYSKATAKGTNAEPKNMPHIFISYYHYLPYTQANNAYRSTLNRLRRHLFWVTHPRLAHTSQDDSYNQLNTPSLSLQSPAPAEMIITPMTSR